MAKSLPRFVFSQAYPKSRIQWARVFASTDCTDADIICWVHVRGARFFLQDYHIAQHALVGAIASLDRSRGKVGFYFGGDIGQFSGKTIFWAPDRQYNPYGFANYSEAAAQIADQLEAQGNRVFPSAREIRLWENKAHMQREFARVGIPHPRTVILHTADGPGAADAVDLGYPLLLKEPHSAGSGGLHKVESAGALRALLADPELVRRCDEVVNWYWRINGAPEWRPTASSFGSTVSFEGFPDHWRPFLLENFKKLEIRTGAFDVAWDNDDLSTEPYFLEVSPMYSPNPHVDLSDRDYEYGAYKKKIFTRNPFIKVYTDFMFDLYERLVHGALQQ